MLVAMLKWAEGRVFFVNGLVLGPAGTEVDSETVWDSVVFRLVAPMLWVFLRIFVTEKISSETQTLTYLPILGYIAFPGELVR